MPIRHPCRDTEEAVGSMSVDKSGLEIELGKPSTHMRLPREKTWIECKTEPRLSPGTRLPLKSERQEEPTEDTEEQWPLRALTSQESRVV